MPSHPKETITFIQLQNPLFVKKRASDRKNFYTRVDGQRLVAEERPVAAPTPGQCLPRRRARGCQRLGIPESIGLTIPEYR